MEHRDHVELLKPAGIPPAGVWADLGAGGGAFTLALRELAGPEAEVYAVDKDRSRLQELVRSWRGRFGDAGHLRLLRADFSHPLDLPALDGILMANSLHFFKDKERLLGQVRDLLKPTGQFLLVEYNVDRGNPWVPYPLSFATFRELAQRSGFTEPKLLSTHPSSFLREFYSASALKE